MRKLFFLLVATLFTSISFSQGLISVTDGTLSDWDKLSPEYLSSCVCPEGASYNGLLSLKAYADDMYLNLLVEYNPEVVTDLAWPGFHVYIDTDNSALTGGYGGQWTTAAFDVLLETAVFADGQLNPYNPSVFWWWGEVGANGWLCNDPSIEPSNENCWGAIVCGGSEPIGNSQLVGNTFEIQLNRELILTRPESPWGDVINIGIDIQQNWSSVGILPAEADDEYGRGEAAPMAIRVAPKGLGFVTYNASDSSAVILDGVTAVEDFPIFNSDSIVSITIPASVTSIAESAFANCSNLREIIVASENGVYSSLNGILYNKPQTDIIHVPRAIKGEVTLSSSLANIKDNAFVSRCFVTSISIPNSVKSIGNWAFDKCTSLTSITCEATTPPTLGSDVFPSNLTTAYIPCDTKEAYEASDWASQVSEFVEEDCEEPIDPTWQITYTSLDGNIVTPYKTDVFGSNIVSNEYQDGQGVITFDGPVTSIGSQAFFNSGLRSISIPNSVESIGEYAFYGCTSLTSVTLGSGVTSIGLAAFSDCHSLTSMVVEAGNPKYDSRENCNAIIEKATNTLIAGCKNTIIPSSVKSIGETAFEGCYFLTSITIPNSVTSIGERAFDGCYFLTSITIPNSVTSIGDWAFYGCYFLTSITIPNSVTSIGEDAFGDCDKLNTMVVEEGNTKYDSRNNCNAIIEKATNTLIAGCQNTTIPNSVTSIGDDAFLGCSFLTSITIPNSVTSIGNGAFDGCTSLTSITIPNTVKSIGEDAFGDCTSLTSITIPNSVDSIGRFTFVSCTSLASITIPNSVTSIGERAFYGCSSLTSVTLGSGVTSIGEEAFLGCTSLASITIPNSVTSIGYCAFYGCSSLTSVTLGSGVTSIGLAAFWGCSSLTSITCEATTPPALETDAFPSELTTAYIPCGTKAAYEASYWAQYVSEFVEEGCEEPIDPTWQITYTSTNGKVTPSKTDVFGANIVSNEYKDGQGVITFDGPVTSIGDSAFYECKSLASVTIGNSVTSIGEFAFYGCYALTSITIPNSVTSIGHWAFGHCYSLTSITIHNSVVSIGNGAFSDCTSLISMVVEPGNTTFDSRENCNAIIETATNTLIAGCQKTVIPNSVTSIGGYAFLGCTFLTSIIIPNIVTSIGDQAFCNCSSLTSVTIGSGVTSIEYNAFGNCTSLTSITCNATTPPALYLLYDTNVFTSSPVCHIPCGTKAAYEASDWASQVSEFVEEGCEEPIDPTWQITYTSTDGNIVTPYKTGVFGANIISNEYTDGQGVITFDGPVTSIGEKAFYYCQNLASIIIPNSVTSIGGYAFAGCTLASISLPNSITSIGDAAFEDCESLKSITIPNSVMSVGSNQSLFGYCDSLTSIVIESGNSVYDSRNNCNAIIETATNTLIAGCQSTVIPNSVTSIGDEAFLYCTTLTSITIPNSVTSIGLNAFTLCTSLTSIAIPSSVERLADNVFGYCTSLTSIVVENDNTTYDSRNNCNAIIETATNTLIAGCQSTVIPNSVTSIGDRAFCGCESLTSITIPNSVTSIGDQAFSSCFLTSISLPESVTSIGDWAFEHCYGFDTIYANRMTPPSIGEGVFAESSPVCYVPCGAKAAYEASDWASQVRKFVELCEEKYTTLTYTSTDGNIVIPSYNDAFGANIVGNTYENGVGTITFDGPVTTIGYHAFTGCRTLASINIPNTVTSIGEYAFGFCTNLTELRIPKSVTSLGADEEGVGIVYQAPNLQRIIVEEGNPVYDSRNNCNAIIETATNTLLSGCKNTNIPSGIKTIGAFAFWGCADLQTIEIPTSVKTIKQGAFYETGLTRFIIPSNVTIEDATYQNTQTILGGAFAGCEQLTEVVIPEGTTRIASGMLAGCSSLESLTIPTSVTSIGEWAFYDCDALTSITIPNGVTSIGEGTFMRCSKLTSITIPSGVTNIGYYAFGECILLSSVICEATTPPMLEDLKGSPVFTSSPICYIPCGTKAVYEASDWAQYVSEFVEEGCSPIQKCGDNLYWEYADGVLTITGTGEMYDFLAAIDAPWYDVCDSIISITMPEEITKIGDYAFGGCSLVGSITIPKSVKEIGRRAFEECTSLARIVFEGELPLHLLNSSRESFDSVFANVMADMEINTLNIEHGNELADLGANVSVENIVYKRKFMTGIWEALILPFEELVSMTMSYQGKEYNANYPWNSTNGGLFYLAEYSGNGEFATVNDLKTKTPYIIQFNNDIEITFTGLSYSQKRSDFKPSSESSEHILVGNITLQNQEMNSPIYYLGDDNNFKYTKTYTLKPFESYLTQIIETSSQINPKRMSVRLRPQNDVTTELPNVEVDQLSWHRNGNMLVIQAEGQPVNIYHINGALIQSFAEGQNEISIELTNGCYLINSAGFTEKIIF